MKFTKKILTENLFLSTDNPKFFTKGRKQNVVISEDQLERLLNVIKEDTNIKELDGIIKEANDLIRHAILTENLHLHLNEYILSEQSEWQGRNPGSSASEGIENILNGIKKAYDMIKDSETRRRLANSMTKLGNFMTITADAIGSGRDQRAMKSADSLREPLPYPELETVSVEDEIEERLGKGDYTLTKEEIEDKGKLLEEDIKKMKQVINPIPKI